MIIADAPTGLSVHGGLSELKDFVLAVAIPEATDVAPLFERLADLDDRGIAKPGDVPDVKPPHFVYVFHVENRDPIVSWGVPAILPLEIGVFYLFPDLKIWCSITFFSAHIDRF